MPLALCLARPEALRNGAAADREVADELQHYRQAAAASRGGRRPRRPAGGAAWRSECSGAREEVREFGWEHWWNGIRRPALRCSSLSPPAGVYRSSRSRRWRLGVGATTAILSVAATVFVQALPLPNADRVHADMGPIAGWLSHRAGLRNPSSNCRNAADRLESRSVRHARGSPTLSGRSEPERLDGLRRQRRLLPSARRVADARTRVHRRRIGVPGVPPCRVVERRSLAPTLWRGSGRDRKADHAGWKRV